LELQQVLIQLLQISSGVCKTLVAVLKSLDALAHKAYATKRPLRDAAQSLAHPESCQLCLTLILDSKHQEVDLPTASAKAKEHLPTSPMMGQEVMARQLPLY
jgi:hypothetical protein